MASRKRGTVECKLRKRIMQRIFQVHLRGQLSLVLEKNGDNAIWMSFGLWLFGTGHSELVDGARAEPYFVAGVYFTYRGHTHTQCDSSTTRWLGKHECSFNSTMVRVMFADRTVNNRMNLH